MNSREFGRAEHYLLRDTYLMALPKERTLSSWRIIRVTGCSTVI